MLNSLEHCISYMTQAKEIVERQNPDPNARHLGIVYRITGYQYWKFYKKSKSTEYLDKALAIFEKHKDVY